VPHFPTNFVIIGQLQLLHIYIYTLFKLVRTCLGRTGSNFGLPPPMTHMGTAIKKHNLFGVGKYRAKLSHLSVLVLVEYKYQCFIQTPKHWRGGGRMKTVGRDDARRAENRDRRPTAGVGFLCRGSKPPSYQLGGLGSAVSSPSGVRGGAPTARRFSIIFSTQDGLSGE